VVLAVVAAALVVANSSHAQRISIQKPGAPAHSKIRPKKARNFDAQIVTNANLLFEEGRNTFRFDTFGDEAFWGGALQLPNAIKGENGVFMNPANKGRYYHDGRFATLLGVVNHYNTRFSLGLTAQEKTDLVEYLKSLP
jgi:cytochrome c peroxidase